jgi:hypothetical protein
MGKQLLLVKVSVDRDRQKMPTLLLLGEAQRSFVSSFGVLNHMLRPTGADQPVAHWHSCASCQRAIGSARPPNGLRQWFSIPDEFNSRCTFANTTGQRACRAVIFTALSMTFWVCAPEVWGCSQSQCPVCDRAGL